MEKWKEYNSTSRNLFRVMWFVNFIYFIITNIVEEKFKDFRDAVKDSYTKAFGEWHGKTL